MSYSHADEEIVFDEVRWLQDQGLNVWYDSTGIGPGSEWNDEIARAIKGANPFLYFVTPQSVASEHCRREVTFAQSENRRVVVAHLQETDLPDGLRLSLDNRQAILKHRLSTLDYRIALLQSLAPGTPTDSVAPGSNRVAHGGGPKRNSLRVGRIAALMVAGLIAGSLITGLILDGSSLSDATPARELRFVASTDPSPSPTAAGAFSPNLAMTRDGTRLIYVGEIDGRSELYVRPLGTLASTRLEGTEGALQQSTATRKIGPMKGHSVEG